MIQKTVQPGVRRRKDPRREATRNALIEAAENLFAERGIDGVSMREIGLAIGAGNTNVVSYHFGGKEQLVKAVIHYRLPGFERRRRELLGAALGRPGGASLQDLVRALWLPLFEQRNEDGRHSYAGFLSALSRSGLGWVRLALSDDYPASVRLAETICEALDPALQDVFFQRLKLSSVLITGVLQIIDLEEAQPPQSETLFADAVEMVCAGLRAPIISDGRPVQST